MVYESKNSSYGYVEIRDASTPGWYALYINGSLKEQSADYSHILYVYNKY